MSCTLLISFTQYFLRFTHTYTCSSFFPHSLMDGVCVIYCFRLIWISLNIHAFVFLLSCVIIHLGTLPKNKMDQSQATHILRIIKNWQSVFKMVSYFTQQSEIVRVPLTTGYCQDLILLFDLISTILVRYTVLLHTHFILILTYKLLVNLHCIYF